MTSSPRENSTCKLSCVTHYTDDPIRGWGEKWGKKKDFLRSEKRKIFRYLRKWKDRSFRLSEVGTFGDPLSFSPTDTGRLSLPGKRSLPSPPASGHFSLSLRYSELTEETREIQQTEKQTNKNDKARKKFPGDYGAQYLSRAGTQGVGVDGAREGAVGSGSVERTTTPRSSHPGNPGSCSLPLGRPALGHRRSF